MDWLVLVSRIRIDSSASVALVQQLLEFVIPRIVVCSSG
jgi:hypothetical protein